MGCLTFEEVIHAAAHNCKKKSIPQLADELGTSESMLRRQLNPHDEAVRFPASKLLGLMLRTKDFSPLLHLARRCNHLAIDLRKIRVRQGNGDDIQNDLHESFPETMKGLALFFRESSPDTQAETLELLDRHLGELLAARKKIENWY